MLQWNRQQIVNIWRPRERAKQIGHWKERGANHPPTENGQNASEQYAQHRNVLRVDTDLREARLDSDAATKRNDPEENDQEPGPRRLRADLSEALAMLQ